MKKGLKKENNLRKWDIGLMIFFPIFAVVVSLMIKANFLTSTLLFFGLPSLWLSYRRKDRVIKTFLFSILFSVPLTIIVDYIATIDKSWYVPTTVFGFRLFNVIPIEDFIWGFFLFYLTIIFYQHFLDRGQNKIINSRMKYLVAFLGIGLFLFFMLFLFKPGALRIKYAYLWIGLLIVLIPCILFLWKYPKLLPRYLKATSYFFVLAFMFELTGLQLGQWTFPGTNFIGWVEMAHHRFPIEEFFFWFCMSTIWILSYFEFFDDNRK